MGLFELPQDEVPPGGFRLLRCQGEGEDADLEIWIEERFLASDWVREKNLVFNVEGYGRFRLWLR
ncbi:MAG: hypothetical protein HY901_24660 [Deltaproteobacteria bacterium]|nr:hypothetical protein [Deltaproteobacteria bacterium]